MLRTYEALLNERNVDCRFSDEELRTVLSSTLELLRRHSRDNRLCCGDEDDDLEVTDVDRHGFVTKVACQKCRQVMEMKCHSASRTRERIYDESTLKAGDHICWHRPYVVWHHAIVTEIDGNNKTVVHYDNKGVVENSLEQVFKRCRCCDVLYRINYQDSYTSDYSVLRARKLLGEKRYRMLQRNCEHFSHWCKTGSKSSSQISILATFFGKMLVMLGVRAIALVILLMILDTSEHPQLETMEKWLSGVYISVISTAFVIYVMYTSILNLHPARRRINNAGISELEYDCTRGGCSSCCPSTCCRRPSNLVCGLVFRIIIREIPVYVSTLSIVLFGKHGSAERRRLGPFSKVPLLILLIAVVQTVVYLIGMCFGRWFEAICESDRCQGIKHRHPFATDPDKGDNENNIQ